MAGRVSTLYVRVVGDVANYERNMVKASASTALFGKEVRSQERHMLQFSRGALLGSGALAGITRAIVFASSAFVGAYGLTYGIKSATDAAKQFQAEMELVATQAGASQREVNKMSKEILKVAPALGQSPDSLSKGLYHLESAGIRGTKAMEALKVAAKGAAIGHAGLEETVNALVGAFKSGISGAGNFGHTMAVLSSIVGAGNIRMQDLEGALGTGVLSAGRAFGLTFKDVGAALATLSVGAVPVQEAATRLRMSFALLGGAGTVKANKALDTIGLSTRKLAQDLRSGGIVKGIGDLKEHLSSLSKIDQTRLLTQAFGGGRFSTSIITLVQQFDLLKQRMGQIDHGVKMFGESWRHTQKTAEFATAKFKASLSVLQIEIGNALLPVLTRTFNAVSKWFDKMNRTGQLQKDIHNTISAIAGIIHYFGVAIKAVEPTVKTFIDLLGGLKQAVIGLGLAWIGMKTGLIPALGAVAKSSVIAGAAGVSSMTKMGTATKATTTAVSALNTTTKASSIPALMGRAAPVAARAVSSTATPLFLASQGAVVPRGAVPVSERPPPKRIFSTGPASAPPSNQNYSAEGYPIGTSPQFGRGSVFVSGPATPTPLKPTYSAEGGLMQEVPQLANRTQAIERAIGLGMHSMTAWSTKTADLITFVNKRLMRLGQFSGLPVSQVTQLEGRTATVQRAVQLGMDSQMAWFTKTSELIDFISMKLAQLTSEMTMTQESGMYLPPSYRATPEPGPTFRERSMSRIGSAARSFGSSIGGYLETKGQGIGLAAAIGAPMAASYLGLPKQVGSITQGAGIGLIGASMMGLNPLAGIAVGTGVAAGRAVGGEKGHFLSGGLIGAGLGAAAGGAIAGAEIGAAGGGPLAPISAPIGALVGGLIGLSVSLLTLKGHSNSAADALGRLARAAPELQKNLGEARKQVAVSKETIAIDKTQVNAAIQTRNQAKEQLAATPRGTKEYTIALDNLHAAQAQVSMSTRGLKNDQNALRGAEAQVTNIVKTQRRNFSESVQVFHRLGLEARASAAGIGLYGEKVSGNAAKTEQAKATAREYSKQLLDLADSLPPNAAKVARALGNIVAMTNRLPSGKTIKVLLTHPGLAAAAARLTKMLGHIPRLIDIKAELSYEDLQAKEAAKYGAGPHHNAAFFRAIDAAKPKPPTTPKPIPPHAFALPQKFLLEQAKASTEGTKAQIKADKDLLAYTEQEIKSGKLTQKGLIDAYNQESQLQNDLASLEKKKKKRKSTSKLAQILPPSFTSAIQRAQAGVSTAQVGGIPTKEFAALSRLEGVYQKALNFLKAEHETGAKRLLQIKEESTLTSKIADTRKQMKALLATEIDNARQQIGALFQGPLLAPTAAQSKAELGMPGPNIGRLTADMKAQTAQYKRFTGDLTKLAKRGAPQELLKELRAMGPDALPYLESLLKGSKKALEAFFKTFAKREMLIQKVAKIEMNAANVVIHAAHLRQARTPRARNPAGRRGSTTRHVPARADGGMVSSSSIQNNYYADGGITPTWNWSDMPRTMSGASGGVVEPVPGGVYRIAEAGHPEMVIPLDPAKRERAARLLDQTHTIVDRANGGMIEPKCYEMGGMVGAKMMGYAEGGIIHPTFGRSQADCIVRGQSSEQAPIELRVFLDGVDITKNVSVRQERKKQSTVPQRRGRHYGVVAT